MSDCYVNRDGCDRATYDVEDIGRIIRNPGKFESETPATVHFWNIGLEGFADQDTIERGDPVYKFRLTSADREAFPELRGKAWLTIVEDSQGFVSAR